MLTLLQWVWACVFLALQVILILPEFKNFCIKTNCLWAGHRFGDMEIMLPGSDIHILYLIFHQYHRVILLLESERSHGWIVPLYGIQPVVLPSQLGERTRRWWASHIWPKNHHTAGFSVCWKYPSACHCTWIFVMSQGHGLGWGTQARRIVKNNEMGKRHFKSYQLWSVAQISGANTISEDSTNLSGFCPSPNASRYLGRS